MPEIRALAADCALGHDVLRKINRKKIPHLMNMRQDQNLLVPHRKKPSIWPAGVLLILAVAAGASYPHLSARKLPGPQGSGQADAIFVLSGAGSRIPAGFRAWKEGKAKELFVLGAMGGARIERILPGRELTAEDTRKVHVEGWSENTMENAYSAKGMAVDRQFRRVIMVTSDYHVPRAYFAFRATLPPEVEISVISVRSEWRERSAFPRTLRLFFMEGVKYWGYRLLLWTV
jgi:uncharacterized SAM-binding protein YcdF (DUF218 family)